jgi:hypothetical protein
MRRPNRLAAAAMAGVAALRSKRASWRRVASSSGASWIEISGQTRPWPQLSSI